MAATWVQVTQFSVKSVQAATEAAPTLPEEGMALTGMNSFRLTVECDVGQSFATAAGQLDLYLYDENVGAWALAIDQEQLIPARAVGIRRFSWVFGVTSPRGKLAFIANGLALTGGGVTLYFSPTISGNASRAV